MKTQKPNFKFVSPEQALDFLKEHFYGIGEEHNDFQEGIKAVDYLENSIVGMITHIHKN